MGVSANWIQVLMLTLNDLEQVSSLISSVKRGSSCPLHRTALSIK